MHSLHSSAHAYRLWLREVTQTDSGVC